MKAVISNRIYIKVDLEQRASLREALTYTLPDETTYCDVVSINSNIISIPVGRTDLIPEGYTIVDKRISIPAERINIVKELDLKKSQELVIDQINDNAIIVANPGWGKTFSGLCIAEKLKQKTLVIVHTVALRDQWCEEVKSLFGYYPGIIGSGIKEYKNNSIVISNVQTLTKMFHSIESAFGLILMDEVHHMPAATFKKVLDKAKSRYKIGLTGTLGRKDGKHIYIPDYFGRNLYYPEEDLDHKETVYKGKDVTIIMHDTGMTLPGSYTTPWSVRLNKLYKNKKFIELITHHANELIEYGHKVLVVADRVEFLKTCSTSTEKSQVIIGSTKDRTQIISELYKDLSCIFGTTSIFKEGISENILSGLVIGVPTSNQFLLKQLIGRVLRLHPGKNTPVIIDPTFKCTVGKSQAKTRLEFYRSQGYEVHVM